MGEDLHLQESLTEAAAEGQQLCLAASLERTLHYLRPLTPPHPSLLSPMSAGCGQLRH